MWKHGLLNLYVKFSYTGSYQIFSVPSGVTTLTIDAYGAQGVNAEKRTQGYGNRRFSTISVTPGQTLYVYIGGQDATGTEGYSGEGTTSIKKSYIAGGEGATDIRSTLGDITSRLVVAGGGDGMRNNQHASEGRETWEVEDYVGETELQSNEEKKTHRYLNAGYLASMIDDDDYDGVGEIWNGWEIKSRYDVNAGNGFMYITYSTTSKLGIIILYYIYNIYFIVS